MSADAIFDRVTPPAALRRHDQVRVATVELLELTEELVIHLQRPARAAHVTGLPATAERARRVAARLRELLEEAT